MTRRALHTFMSWEEIAEHYANQLGEVVDRHKFIEWFLTKKDIGKGALVLDSMTYAWCYKVSERLKSEKKDQFTVVVGDEGVGKSWTAAQVSAIISPSFSKKNILFEPDNVMQAYLDAEKGDTIHIDEGVLFLYSRSAMTKDNVNTTKIFQLIRQKYLHNIICIPNFKDLDTYVRNHRVDTLIHVTAPGVYKVILKDGINVINEVFPHKKKKISQVKLPASSFFHGFGRKIFPTINDLDLDAYKSDKARNLREELIKLRDSYKKGAKKLLSGTKEVDVK